MKYFQPSVSTFYRALAILFFYGFANTLPAQNIVPNGSFEEAITCPTTTGNVTSECANWYSSLLFSDGVESTPEWFHECSEFNLLSPPDVAFGSQTPYDGGGFAGLVAFSVVTPNGRELIAVELIEPLNIGNTYLVEFEVSNFYFADYVVASNRLGFNFSTHPYYSTDNFPLNTSHYSESEIIPATGEWYSISQMFVADSAYQYFHIGNFYDDDHTNYIANSPYPDASYYAVDNVSVTGILSNGARENSESGVKVFPNPVSQNLKIVIPEGQFFNEIRVYDSIGNQVIWVRNTNHIGQYSISVSDLNKGMYHMQIVTSNTTYYETFVKT